MQYHLFLTCQRKYAKALFTALSSHYRAHLPQITPLHYGLTRIGDGFVVVAWHGELALDALEQLARDPRVIDAASYPVPFFEYVPREEEDEESEQARSRLSGPLSRERYASGEEHGR